MTQETTATNNAMERYDEILDVKDKKAQVRKELLDELLSDRGSVVVSKAHMGLTDSYVGTVSLPWIADHVSLFSELPLMQEKLDEKGKIVIDESTINDLQQRAPDWSRQTVLAHYLISSASRKFPALLVVITEPWVNNPKAPEWDENHRATKSSWTVMKLDSRGRIALIEMDGGAMAYAVDGQHRLLGIMAVNDLLKEGFLTIRNKDRKETGMEQKGELLARYGLTLAELEKFRTEMVGIEFIAAVMEGETYEEARRRIRSIFVHVNKTAKPLSAGEIAILDEDDGFAIVARQVALDYPLFKKDRPGDRVNWKSNALPAGGLWLTTVSTLREMTKDYLQGRMPFRKWLPSRKDEIPVRPGDDELMPGEDEMTELWDYIGTLPVFEDIKSGGEIDEWREFHDKGGRGHLLMRPVGQQALALAVGRLHQSEAGPNLPLETIFAKLRRFDKDGGFEQDRPSSAWFGITYEPTRGRMVTGSENLGALMLEYLINGLDEDGRKDLLEAYRLRRWTAAEDGQEFGLNFDGKQVTDREAIQLPPLI